MQNNQRVILNIAGLGLRIDSFSRTPSLDSLNKFIFTGGAPKIPLWHLESRRVDKNFFYDASHLKELRPLRLKKRLARFPALKKDLKTVIDNYSPIFIDPKNRKIVHFALNQGKKSSPPFITYAYAQILALSQGLLLHSSAVVKNKKAYLFFGASGEGKSTVAELSKSHQVLGDDVIVIKKKGSQYFAFSTPWKQKPFIKPRPCLSAPLEAIFFLKKAKKISFKPISKPEALVRILSWHTHFFFYTARPMVDKIFFTAARLVKSIPAYEMEFSKDKDFWPALERCLKHSILPKYLA
jgi:hypothetical protein